MLQFHKLMIAPLLFWTLLCSFQIQAAGAEPKDKFLQSLEGIERQVYALPQKSLAQIEQLEEDSLLQNQPRELLVRYYLAKSTVLELLGRQKESSEAAKKGLSLAPKQSREHLLLELHQIQAMMGKNDINEAVSSLDTLLKTSRANGDKQLESEVLLVKGRYYEVQGDFKKSYAAIMSSLEAAESSGVQGQVERAALGLGDVLVKIQGYGRSETVLNQAYRYFKERRMSFNELLSVLTIAKLHKAQFQYDKAIDAYQDALKLAQIIGDGRFRFRINLELASLYRETDNDRNMLRHLRLAENLQYRETSSAYLATFRLLQAQYMLEQKKFDELLAMITPMLPEIIKSPHIQQQQLELLKVAAQAYAGANNFQQAYQSYGQYHNKFIQFSNDREMEKLERQQILFELERLEYENQDLNWNNVLQRMELENNRRTFYLLGEIVIALLAVILLLAVVFLAVNRSRIRMRRLAKTDTLTGLFNRRFLEEWFMQPITEQAAPKPEVKPQSLPGKVTYHLRQQWKRVQSGYAQLNKWLERKLDKKVVVRKPETGPITMVMIDVDHFKQVNDTYGHVFGDVVLTGVAKVLESSVRDSDIVARLGGEEFVVVLPKTDLEESVALAERLREAVAQQGFVTESEQAVNVTSSFGVLTTHQVDMEFEALCNQADKLLYEAKASGRNCVKALQLS